MSSFKTSIVPAPAKPAADPYTTLLHDMKPGDFGIAKDGRVYLKGFGDKVRIIANGYTDEYTTREYSCNTTKVRGLEPGEQVVITGV